MPVKKSTPVERIARNGIAAENYGRVLTNAVRLAVAMIAAGRDDEQVVSVLIEGIAAADDAYEMTAGHRALPRGESAIR